MIIINLILGKIAPSNNKLSITICQIEKEVNYFIGSAFFHVKHDLNIEVYHWDNKATDLSNGCKLKMGRHVVV